MTKRTWTLRDMRRWVARSGSIFRSDFIAAARSVERHTGVNLFTGLSTSFDLAALDRLISRFGPGWTPPREERRKQTDEVDGSRQTGDATHGGDSVSGEVKDGENSQGRPDHDGAGQDSQEATRTESVGHRETGGSATGGPGSSPEVNPKEGEPTEGSGAPNRTDGRRSTDNPSRDGDGCGSGADDASETGDSVDAERGDGEATSPGAPKLTFGGVNVSEDDLRRDLDLNGTWGTRDVVRALRKLFRSFLLGTAPSPRLDGRRLVTELVSRRMAIGRARRRELGDPYVLLMADTSGSCAGVALATTEAAIVIAKELDEAVTVVHSNGHPLWVVHRGEVFDVKIDGAGRDENWWEENIFSLNLTGAVAFGDLDAYWVYRWLAERIPLVLLDDYAAVSGAKPVPPRGSLRDLVDWPVEPLAWWQGVNSADRAAIALRSAVRKIK